MHFYNHHIIALFLYYIIRCLSIISINENNNGLPFCFNLSTIFINIKKLLIKLKKIYIFKKFIIKEYILNILLINYNLFKFNIMEDLINKNFL